MKLALPCLVLLAACGDDPPTFIDAGPIDASTVDAEALVDAGPTVRVTVHVRSLAADGAADPAATVFFVDPDGGIAAQDHPDGSGTITRDVGAGGSVTVGWPGDGITLVTVVGVEDDDELWFGPEDEQRDQRVTVTVPARAGSSSYSLLGPCMNGGNIGTTIISAFSRRCGPTHPLLVASGAGAGMPSWYLSAPAVTPTDGGTVAVQGAWNVGTTTSVALTGIPAGTAVVSIDRSVLSGGTDVARFQRPNLPVVGGGATASFDVPAGFGDGARLEVFYQRDGRRYRAGIFRPLLSEPAPLDVAPAVPDLTAVTRDGATVSWTLAGTGAYDAVAFDLVQVGKGEGLIAAWRVVAPPGVTSVTLPALPAPFDQRAIPFAAITLIEAAHLSSAAFRAGAGTGAWIDAPPIPAPNDTRWLRVEGPLP